jgi:phage baseplate assembly protein W
MAEISTTLYGVKPPKQITLDLTSRSKKKYGFAFPTGKGKGGGDYPKQAGITLLKNNLEQLILTEKGERVMFPQFGMSLRKFVFEQLTEELFIEIQQEVTNAIASFMPNLTVIKLSITEANTVNVEGGRGLDILLVVSAEELNNTPFNVGVTVT